MSAEYDWTIKQGETETLTVTYEADLTGYEARAHEFSGGGDRPHARCDSIDGDTYAHVHGYRCVCCTE
jgi:hypothetical protein